MLSFNLFFNLFYVSHPSKDPLCGQGMLLLHQSTRMFVIYIDNLKSLNDNLIKVTPLTLEAHYIFYKIPDGGFAPTGDSASLSSKCSGKINKY